MNSLFIDGAKRVLAHHIGVRPAGIGVAAVVLAMLLVFERELLRPADRDASRALVREMRPLIAPLLLAFVFILGVRFARYI
jgi:hypothetical protein